MSNKVPQIRFNGYSDAWEERKLTDISEKVTEKNSNNEFSETLTNSAEYGIISQRDFFDKDISNEKNLNTYYVVRDGDFVYNPRISNFAPVGPIKRNTLGRTGVMSPLYYVFRTNDIDGMYLEKYFSSTKWHRFMELNGDTGARADRFAIKDKDFVQMPIPLPSLDEQSKIAHFLESVDNLIAANQRKLDLLKEQKKGYLQKMFPKNGAKVPELRFAGFADDWEERKFGELLKEFSIKSKIEDEYNVLSSTNSGMEFREGRVSGTSNLGYKIIKNGDLVLSPQNLWLGNININNIGKGLVSPSYKTFEFRNIDSSFINPQLRTQKMLEEYKNSSTQGASVVRRNLEIDSLYQIKIFVPTVTEQAKIGSFFKQLDNTIALHQRKLDLLKEQKKGLLQKMFPKQGAKALFGGVTDEKN